MKKLLIASVSMLALSAGAALAQTTTTSTLIQGGSVSATIDQASPGSSNTSTVYQGVYGNGYTAAGSSVSVTQVGDAVSSVTSSSIQQNGGNQNAIVNQNAALGGSQTSNITQSNSNNYANVSQTTAGTLNIQQSFVTQSGQNGRVTVTQTGPADLSSITQTSNNNNYYTGGYTSAGYVYGGVNVNQGGGAANTSYVTQSSDYSGVGISQSGTGGTNASYVTLKRWWKLEPHWG